MFTGIITEVGKVSAVRKTGGGVRLTIAAPGSVTGLRNGDSISINGVCQTVIDKSGDRLTVEAVEETLKKTTLGELKKSSPVNLELPVRLGDRMGGHLVQGHVDCVGIVRAVAKQESSRLISVGFPVEFSRYVIPVGSIAIDGISLTVAMLKENLVTVSIIPHTLENTTLSLARERTRVNLEFDLIGKYIERLLSGGSAEQFRSQITLSQLREWGYDG
jgi:riboflavin synthase